MWFWGGRPRHALDKNKKRSVRTYNSRVGWAVKFTREKKKQHILIWKDCIPHNVFYAGSLAEKGIDDRSPWWDQGGLAEEGEQSEDAVEGLEVLLSLRPDCHSLAKLSQDNQVQDDRAGQERVLLRFKEENWKLKLSQTASKQSVFFFLSLSWLLWITKFKLE